VAPARREFKRRGSTFRPSWRHNVFRLTETAWNCLQKHGVRSRQTPVTHLIAQLLWPEAMQFSLHSLPISRCSSWEVLDFRSLGYFRRPLTITTPRRSKMTSLKARLYSPALILAVSVIAAAGGSFRGG
jgi:hypothetical protein